MVCLSTVLCSLAAALTLAPNVDAGEGTPPRVRTSHFDTHFTIKAGERRLQLTCPVDSDTELMTEWSKDGEAIGAGWLRYSVGGSGRKLKIKNVAKGDTGRYSCEAVNGFGRQVVHFTVVVFDEEGAGEIDYDTVLPDGGHDADLNVAPSFAHVNVVRSMSSQAIQRAVGEEITLSCIVEGSPLPSVAWMINKQRLTLPRLRQMGWRVSDDGQTIAKKGLRVSDKAQYTCQGVNIVGHIDATFDLRVSPSGLQPSRFAVDDPHPMNTSVKIGGRSQMKCNVHSPIAPMIKWLRKVTAHATGGTLIDVMVDGEALTVAVVPGQRTEYSADERAGVYTNTLTIDHVEMRDAGEYICFVTDSTGTLQHRLATLAVHGGGGGGGAIDGETNTTQLLIACATAASAMIGLLVCVIVICRCCSRHSAVDKRGGGGTQPNMYHQQPPPPSRPAPPMPQPTHTLLVQASPRTPYSTSMQHTYKTSLMSASSTGAYQQFEAPPMTYEQTERHIYESSASPQPLHRGGVMMGGGGGEDYGDGRYPTGRIQPYPSMYSCR